MKSTHFIFMGEGTNGGTATLAIRMTKWLIRNKYNVTYLYRECTNKMLEKELHEAGAKMVKNSSSIKGFKQVMRDIKEQQAICFSHVIELYLLVDIYKKSFDVSIYNCMYVVNLWSFQRLVGGSNIIKKIGSEFLKKFFFRNLCLQMNKSHELIFMDNDSLFETEKFLEIKLNNPNIMYLPIEIPAEKSPKHGRNKGSIVITTITRMEFPFKGYVLDLIDLCEELSKNVSLQLQIIGDGSDFSQLQAKVKKSKIADNIFLLRNQPYDKLKKYFQKSDLFVGMGTTVLDAALEGIPVIPVRCHTMKCLANQFFHESTLMAPRFDTPIESYCMDKLLKKIISCSDEEYYAIGKKSREIVEEKYNLDIFMKQLFQTNLNIEMQKPGLEIVKKLCFSMWKYSQKKCK